MALFFYNDLVLNKEDLALVEAIIEKIVVAGNKQYQEKDNSGKDLVGKKNV